MRVPRSAPNFLTLTADLTARPREVKRAESPNLEQNVVVVVPSVRDVQRALAMDRRALCVVIAMAVACGQTDEATPGITQTVHAAIQGGSDDADHRFALGVCVGREGDACAGICSGTLVAKSVVVTARHCFDAPSPGPVDCAQSRFTGLTRAPRASWVTTDAAFSSAAEWRRVAAVVTPDGPAFCGNDVALLVLETPVDGVPVAEPATSVLAADVGATSTVIGYGASAPGDASAGSAGRRRVRDVPVACVPGDPARDCGSRLASARELLAGDGTCSGDSGAGLFATPTLAGAKPLLLGVFSRGGASADGTRCERAIYTRMDALRPFVAAAVRAAAETAGGDAPDWIAHPSSLGLGSADAATDGPSPAPGASASASGCAATGQRAPDRAWAFAALAGGGALVARRRRVSAGSSRRCRPQP